MSVVFLESSIDNINEAMPDISDGIVQGDRDYNESVELLNNRYFYDADEKAMSAGEHYNKSLNKLNEISEKFDKDLNEVHKEYIDAAINELKLKLKAVEELNESIYYLRDYYNYTGSTHGTEANDLMDNAMNYQNQRNEILEKNPKLFN